MRITTLEQYGAATKKHRDIAEQFTWYKKWGIKY